MESGAGVQQLLIGLGPELPGHVFLELEALQAGDLIQLQSQLQLQPKLQLQLHPGFYELQVPALVNLVIEVHQMLVEEEGGEVEEEEEVAVMFVHVILMPIVMLQLMEGLIVEAFVVKGMVQILHSSTGRISN